MVKSCFEFDPEKRATCVNLLNHGYFDDRFKVSFENEMAEILGKEIRDKHLSYRRSISNESQSPEPNLLSKFTSRDTTPNRTGQKSIGTIRFNPDDLIPFTKTPELCEERHIGPPPNFLPNIKLRRDEDSHNSSFHGLKKKNSELKIPLIKQIKHTNDYHPHHHKLKNIEFGSSVIEKSHNLSTIYEIRDVAIGDQTIRSRNNSKSHIKQRHPDHPYFQSVPTPLPSSKLKNTQYMTKKTKITLYYSYSLKSGMSSNSPNVSRLVKP